MEVPWLLYSIHLYLPADKNVKKTLHVLHGHWILRMRMADAFFWELIKLLGVNIQPGKVLCHDFYRGDVLRK